MSRNVVTLPATSLTQENLAAVASRGIPVPAYDRTGLVPRILHVGVGGFHRAHLATYTDEAAAAGGDWGVRGVGLLEADRRMAEILGAQDHLYTVIERDGGRAHPRVVGSIVDFAFEDAFVRHVAEPETAIVSLTITEGGYSVATRNPTIETIVDALDARRLAGGKPLTVLSCDNLPGNGDVARQAITAVAATRNGELARYVETDCGFPNSMVDRITPQTKDEDRDWLRDEFGIEDGWPVVCETFRQWVIEDTFAAGRPAWEDVGVLFSNRVHDWELYKLRLLNAGHSCLAYLSALAGATYVDEAMATPPVHGYLERFLNMEAIPTLAEIPGHPAAEYAATVLHRFENTGVRDQVARLCIDGTAKFPSFLIPTVQAQLERDGPISCSALALAAWRRYLATVPDGERAPDQRGERAVELARASLGEPLRFLELDEVFTPPLRESRRFRSSFAAADEALVERGPIQAMTSTIDA